MKCPACGAAEMIHDSRDIPYTYMGKLTIIPHIEADFCPDCGESVLDSAIAERLSNSMLAFNRQDLKRFIG